MRFWTFGREGEATAELLQDFHARNPGIRVEIQRLPWISAHEKLLTAYAGETLPDVCQLGNTWVPEFAALNALEPLDESIRSSSVVLRPDYFDGVFEANRIDAEVFAVPWYVDTRLLYYRTDLLAKAGFNAPPQTWAEWSQMLGAVKQFVGPDRYSVLLPLNEFEPLLVLALQQPSDVLRDGGRFGNFRSDDFRRTLAFYADIFANGWAPRMTNTQLSNVWDEFGNGLFTFYISGPWNIPEFRKRLPAELQDAWMTAPMPGPDGPGLSSAGGSGLVIFRTASNKPGAWKLIEYLSQPETQRRFYDLTGNIPPRRTSWEAPALQRSPYAHAFLAQLDRVRSPPKVPEWERIAQEMRLASERVVQGRMSVDAAVVALDATTDALLEKRRWMLERN
ncbi:sugar ABC transporter substrate-binding protein [Povalibacter sp.]|uniref:sugar ABC transporter substrate-binding protein n=1 Tax=Povalibacter sp. TaxID=1962978 RepID=UPI002D1FA3C2|nr:sugar ABC transporter substrate-binding protein [Povalibacter sp.]